MSDLESFFAFRRPKKTDQKQPRNILKSRTKRTVNHESKETIKFLSSPPPSQIAAPVQIPKTTILKQNGEKAVEINLNIQLPSTTPESVSSTKDLKEIRKTVKQQNLQIQSLQNKLDATEKKDAERKLQIQLQNDEIQRLKNSLKNERENYLFLFDSNSKLWSALNILEKRISSNDTKTIDHPVEKEKTKEAEPLKNLTIWDIDKYLTANPNDASFIEVIAKNIQETQNRKKFVSEEESYGRKIKEERKMLKISKEKNVQNWATSTIDDKLKKYGMKLSNTVIYENEKSSSNAKVNPRPKFVLSPRPRRSSPTNSIISVSSCGSEFECSTFIENCDLDSFTDATNQPDQFSNDDFTDDEILQNNDSFSALKSQAPIKSILRNAEVFDAPLLHDKNRSARHSTNVTEQPDIFDGSWTDATKKLSSISSSKNDKAEISLLKCANNFNSSIISKINQPARYSTNVTQQSVHYDTDGDELLAPQKSYVSSPYIWKSNEIMSNSKIDLNKSSSRMNSIIKKSPNAAMSDDSRSGFFDYKFMTSRNKISSDALSVFNETSAEAANISNFEDTVVSILLPNNHVKNNSEIQSSFVDATAMLDRFDDNWSKFFLFIISISKLKNVKMVAATTPSKVKDGYEVPRQQQDSINNKTEVEQFKARQRLQMMDSNGYYVPVDIASVATTAPGIGSVAAIDLSDDVASTTVGIPEALGPTVVEVTETMQQTNSFTLTSSSEKTNYYLVLYTMPVKKRKNNPLGDEGILIVKNGYASLSTTPKKHIVTQFKFDEHFQREFFNMQETDVGFYRIQLVEKLDSMGQRIETEEPVLGIDKQPQTFKSPARKSVPLPGSTVTINQRGFNISNTFSMDDINFKRPDPQGKNAQNGYTYCGGRVVILGGVYEYLNGVGREKYATEKDIRKRLMQELGINEELNEEESDEENGTLLENPVVTYNNNSASQSTVATATPASLNVVANSVATTVGSPEALGPTVARQTTSTNQRFSRAVFSNLPLQDGDGATFTHFPMPVHVRDGPGGSGPGGSGPGGSTFNPHFQPFKLTSHTVFLFESINKKVTKITNTRKINNSSIMKIRYITKC